MHTFSHWSSEGLNFIEGEGETVGEFTWEVAYFFHPNQSLVRVQAFSVFTTLFYMTFTAIVKDYEEFRKEKESGNKLIEKTVNC